MRPLYETDKDRKAQKRILDIISAWGSCTYSEQDIDYGPDAILYRNDKPCGVIEVKRRDISPGQYDTIILSKGKVEVLNLRSKILKFKPPLFAVECNDESVWVAVIRPTDEYVIDEHGGRTKKTRDPYDIGPVCHIPWADFRRAS